MSLLFVREGGQWRPDGGVKAKLLQFAELPRGWHFGRGGPIPMPTIESALTILGMADVLGIEANAFPGEGGEVALAFYGHDRVLEVVVGCGGPETVFLEPIGVAGGDVEAMPVSSESEVYPTLLDLTGRPEWRSRDSSIHFISVSEYHESPILHSSTQVEIQTGTMG